MNTSGKVGEEGVAIAEMCFSKCEKGFSTSFLEIPITSPLPGERMDINKFKKKSSCGSPAIPDSGGKMVAGDWGEALLLSAGGQAPLQQGLWRALPGLRKC